MKREKMTSLRPAKHMSLNEATSYMCPFCDNEELRISELAVS